MTNKLPRKALVVVSSFNGPIYPTGHKTGLFLTEALHPYEVLVAAGFDVDLASETGTFGFDFNSLEPPFLSGSDKAIYNNSDHPFMVKLNSELKKASDLKKGEYGVFFASADHAALYDYPTAKGLQAIAADVWGRGGIVGTVTPPLVYLRTRTSCIANPNSILVLFHSLSHLTRPSFSQFTTLKGEKI